MRLVLLLVALTCAGCGDDPAPDRVERCTVYLNEAGDIQCRCEELAR